MITIDDVVEKALSMLVPYPRVFMTNQEKDLVDAGFEHCGYREIVDPDACECEEPRLKPAMRMK